MKLFYGRQELIDLEKVCNSAFASGDDELLVVTKNKP